MILAYQKSRVRSGVNTHLRRDEHGVNIADGFKRDIDTGDGVDVADGFKRDVEFRGWN